MRVKFFIVLLLQVCVVATWAKPHPMDADVPTNNEFRETTIIATDSQWESYSADSGEKEGNVLCSSVVFIQFS